MRSGPIPGYDYDHIPSLGYFARAQKVHALLGCSEGRRRLVRHQEPATVALLEYVRYEGVEAQGFAVLAQELHLLDTDGPRDLPVGTNVGFGQGDGDAVELAEAHFPSLPDAVPADHDCRAEGTDECCVGLVRPHLVHRANITGCYRRNESLTRSLYPVDIRRILNPFLAESAADGQSCYQQECCKSESTVLNRFMASS